MLERLTGLPPGVEGVKAVGKVSKEDYDQVLEPMLNEARKEGRRVRFLYELGAEFEGITPAAAWEDAKIGLRSMRLFDGCAIVTDTGWLRESARLAGLPHAMPGPNVSGPGTGTGPWSGWARFRESAGISHRLLPESGVIVVEVKEAFRAQDFDALETTADTWIEAHGNLQGLVIHAREFPGWENLGSLWRHLRFVRDHHRKVKRIALAADTKLASLAAGLSEHFGQAEVKRFPYGELENAIAWAGGGEHRSRTP